MVAGIRRGLSDNVTSKLNSATVTTAAPSRNAADAAASPTGPAPDMSTVELAVTPALT